MCTILTIDLFCLLPSGETENFQNYQIMTPFLFKFFTQLITNLSYFPIGNKKEKKKVRWHLNTFLEISSDILPSSPLFANLFLFIHFFFLCAGIIQSSHYAISPVKIVNIYIFYWPGCLKNSFYAIHYHRLQNFSFFSNLFYFRKWSYWHCWQNKID